MEYEKKHNRFDEICAAKVSQILFGIRDPYCGMKSYNLGVLKKSNLKFLPGDKIGYGLVQEVFFQFGKNSIKQIEIDGIKRADKSRFSNKTVITNLLLISNIFKTLILARYKKNKGHLKN